MDRRLAVVRMEISLRACTALRKLTLRHHSPLSSAVLGLLSEVAAPLRSITLGVLDAPDAHSLPDFAPIAAHISEALMSTLQEERVLYSGPVPERVVLAKLQRDLPVIHARGVLKVQHVE